MLSIIAFASAEKQEPLDLVDHKDVNLIELDQWAKNDLLVIGKAFQITK
jgi:hypothetical protein